MCFICQFLYIKLNVIKTISRRYKMCIELICKDNISIFNINTLINIPFFKELCYNDEIDNVLDLTATPILSWVITMMLEYYEDYIINHNNNVPLQNSVPLQGSIPLDKRVSELINDWEIPYLKLCVNYTKYRNINVEGQEKINIYQERKRSFRLTVKILKCIDFLNSNSDIIFIRMKSFIGAYASKFLVGLTSAQQLDFIDPSKYDILTEEEKEKIRNIQYLFKIKKSDNKYFDYNAFPEPTLI